VLHWSTFNLDGCIVDYNLHLLMQVHEPKVHGLLPNQVAGHQLKPCLLWEVISSPTTWYYRFYNIGNTIYSYGYKQFEINLRSEDIWFFYKRQKQNLSLSCMSVCHLCCVKTSDFVFHLVGFMWVSHIATHLCIYPYVPLLFSLLEFQGLRFDR
jgi:hypothetical protein